MCLVSCLSVPVAKVGIIFYNALLIFSRKNGLILFVPKPAGFGTNLISHTRFDYNSYLTKLLYKDDNTFLFKIRIINQTIQKFSFQRL